MYWLASLFAASYFLGAIPVALIIGKLKKIDLREVGSGNLGATNVYRTLGFRYALIVFLLDAFKAYIPTIISIYYFKESPILHILIGLTVIVGHSLSVFVKFKGGKGVACALGTLLAINPIVFTIVFTIGFPIIAIFKYVAPVTILGSVSVPVLLYLFKEPMEYTYTFSLVALFIVYRHKSNIKRILEGKENKI